MPAKTSDMLKKFVVIHLSLSRRRCV